MSDATANAAPTQNIYTRSSIWRMFRDAADEDYLVARMAARSRLHFQFCWSSQQAIEKYLKAILLLNDREISFRHDLVSMYAAVSDIAEDLLPMVLCPPNGFPRDGFPFGKTIFEPSITYVKRVERSGHPDNRYRSHSVTIDFGDLNKLDQICFLLRRLAFPLEMSVEGYGKTARQVLRNDRRLQIHPKMGFEKNLHEKGAALIDESFRWRNFSFFFEEAMAAGKICTGASAINADISLLIDGENEQLSALEWLASHAFPKRVKIELQEEIARRRAG